MKKRRKIFKARERSDDSVVMKTKDVIRCVVVLLMFAGMSGCIFQFLKSFKIRKLLPQRLQYGDLTDHYAEQPPQNSYEYYFHKAGLPQYFLNLRGIQRGPFTEWLLKPQLFRSIGAVYSDSNPSDYFMKLDLTNVFDVIVYFEHTSASHLRHT